MFNQRSETGNIKFVVQSHEILAHCEVLSALTSKYRKFYDLVAQNDSVNVNEVLLNVFNALHYDCSSFQLNLFHSD